MANRVNDTRTGSADQAGKPQGGRRREGNNGSASDRSAFAKALNTQRDNTDAAKQKQSLEADTSQPRARGGSAPAEGRSNGAAGAPALGQAALDAGRGAAAKTTPGGGRGNNWLMRPRGRGSGPRAPGLKPLAPASGPNDFRIDVDGPNPDLKVGGSHYDQEVQRDATTNLLGHVMTSYVTGHNGLPRVPGDQQVSHVLDQLPPNRPIGRDGDRVTHAVYHSHIPNATPEQAYRHMVDQPGQVFTAGGMEIRPASGRLQDGGRYMLENGNPAPNWLPVQIRLHPDQHAVTIHTLQGHMLRGRQTFTFRPDGRGGTNVTQNAHFQASSQLPGKLQTLAPISRAQHTAWREAHRQMYEQFNGNPDYQGIGTQALSKAHLRAWANDVDQAAAHPGRAADGVLDSAGVGTNWAIDQAGESMADRLDRLDMPGGGAVRNGADRLGDWSARTMDKAGDAARQLPLWPWAR